MATTYRSLTNNDIVKTRTRLHEYIPITGSILSGSIYSDKNVKTFSHGLYESVYDYPHLSSSANHIMDITYGAFTSSAIHTVESSEKGRIYQLYSQVLMGFHHDDSRGSGKITQNYAIQFDQDGNMNTATDKINQCYLVNFSRLLVKDEIKKGSFMMRLGVSNNHQDAFHDTVVITDSATATANRTVTYNAANQFRTNATVGEYGFLYMSGSNVNTGRATAIDALDTTGVDAANADCSFTIDITTAAGGENGVITILLDNDQTTDPDESSNRIAIGISGKTDAQIAALIIKAINGTADSNIDFASSGRGQTRVGGIFAQRGTTATKITLTMIAAGTAGNLTNKITAGAGVDIVDVRSFTGGAAGVDKLDKPVGLLFYQPGVMVLTSSIFNDNMLGNYASGQTLELTSSITDRHAILNGTIKNLARAFRNRISSIRFNNTVEINSTIYMCRAHLGDYNYSSNPTYLKDNSSQIVVKNERTDQPVSYVSTIGMYSSDNELLAVAKTSEPLRKDPTNELTMRVRLDY